MATLATAPGECCVKTVQHVGTARGEIMTIADVPTYVSPPGNGVAPFRKILLYFGDVNGPMYINAQLVMDYFAAQGYLTVGLDYFEGDPYWKHKDDLNFQLRPWAIAKLERAKVLVPPWIAAIKERYGGSDTKYATVGYCFGAPFVMDCVASDWVAAAAFAHPGFLDESHFQKAIKPLLLSCAEIDDTFPMENRRKAVDILIERKATFHVQLFSTVKHGFALRGNPDIPVERWAKEESARTILSWFNRFCD